jgi:hypothetical protein
MAIQGMAMAISLRNCWLNETHPKVLYFDQTQLKYAYGDEMR